MGNWQLEVFRMSLYISFPVGLFYFFNQPEFFENWMMEKRGKLFPPKDPRAKEMIEAYLEKTELRREQEMLAAFHSKESN